MKLKKIGVLLSALVLTMGIGTIGVSASTIPTTKHTPITQNGLFDLLEKYNIKVLSSEEVSSLHLVKGTGPELPSSMSMEELEQYIIEQQKQSNVVIKNEATVPIKIDKNTNSFKSDPLTTNALASPTQTIISTKTFSYSSTPLTDLTIRTSATGAYQYDYTDWGFGPPEISNVRFLSCDNGSVIQTSGAGYNRLSSVTSSTCKIYNSTTLKHDYSYIADMYTCIGVPNTPVSVWVKISSRTVTGTSYYYLSV